MSSTVPTPRPLVREAQHEDVPVLLEMFRELAVYERLEHELHATEEGLREGLFGERPVAQALIAEHHQVGQGDPGVLGYALFFPTFSTFLTAPGVWLEDLFVRPSHRGAGIGRALLAAVAAHTRSHAGERLEWGALNWNEPALGFYRRLGVRAMGDWIPHRLDGQALDRLADMAGECSVRSDGQTREKG